MASLMMQSVQVWSMSTKRLCYHAWDMTTEAFDKNMLTSYIIASIFISCNGLSKSSLLTFYLQISPQKWYKFTIWNSIALVTSYTSIIAGLLLCGCRPMHASWYPYAFATGQCVDTASLYRFRHGAFHYPEPNHRSFESAFDLEVGSSYFVEIVSVTVATSIVRIIYLPSLPGARDITWVTAPAKVWLLFEVNLFITSGFMPKFHNFLMRLAPRVLCSLKSSRSAYEMSASKANRQQRTGYTQFDGVEMDDQPDKKFRGFELRSTALGVREDLTLVSRGLGSTIRTDTSGEAIPDNKSIA